MPGGCCRSERGGLLFFCLRAGDGGFNRRFTRVHRFSGDRRRGLQRFGLLFLCFGAGDGGFYCGFARVRLGCGVFAGGLLCLTGAGLGFARFAGGNDFAVIRLAACLNHNRLSGGSLFFAHASQRRVNRLLILGRRLHRSLLMTLGAGDFLPLKARLSCFKAGFGFRVALFFLGDGVDFRLFLAEILHQRNIAWTDPGAGAAFDTIGQIIGRRFIVLLAFTEPVKLLRQQVRRAGVGAGAATNAAFLFRLFAHLLRRGGKQAVGDLHDRHIQPGQGKAHQRAAHDHHLVG